MVISIVIVDIIIIKKWLKQNKNMKPQRNFDARVKKTSGDYVKQQELGIIKKCNLKPEQEVQ